MARSAIKLDELDSITQQNQRNSRFLRIPVELRYEIYGFVFSTATAYRRPNWGPEDNETLAECRVLQDHREILQTCRQTRQEAIFYEGRWTTLHLPEYASLFEVPQLMTWYQTITLKTVRLPRDCLVGIPKDVMRRGLRKSNLPAALDGVTRVVLEIKEWTTLDPEDPVVFLRSLFKNQNLIVEITGEQYQDLAGNGFMESVNWF
ncbi:hypothetical protein C7974DRAFT_410800 [Boeremia exigua]|uniref:uncharacterized protein n=1 Tax=Boeremia exigua TaxID=749465 RepID=UPI001E8E73A9|nr:uncharacterized protein C7974DRAFT_410800 [Boeremia exigua]KAH6639850.1 hypothetical protein C7974DRAFT_410800 [Boeremia exigua]